MKDIISIIHACDKNAYAWEGWYNRYKKYWPIDKIPTVFLSENKPLNKEGIISLTLGTGWQQGIIKAIDNHISEHYIIYQHEDFYLTGTVDVELLGNIFDLMKEKDADLMKCCGPHSGWKPSKTIELDDKPMDNRIKRYANSNEYLTSHQMSIWKTEFFRSSLDMKHDNWQHELQGTIKVRKLAPIILTYQCDKHPPDCQPIPYVEVIKHGKYKQHILDKLGER